MKLERVNNHLNFIQNLNGFKLEKTEGLNEAHTVFITLESGESLEKKTVYADMFLYVIEGKCVVEIGNKKTTINDDEMIITPANTPYCLYNETDSVLKVLAIKTSNSKRNNIRLLNIK